jgi:hypothetical protein
VPSVVEQPENREPEVPTEAPDADLRAAIDGLGDLGDILKQALADDDALAAGEKPEVSRDE